MTRLFSHRSLAIVFPNGFNIMDFVHIFSLWDLPGLSSSVSWSAHNRQRCYQSYESNLKSDWMDNAGTWVGIVSIYMPIESQPLHEQVPSTLTCTSRRTWAFRLCSRPYPIWIFNFFFMDLCCERINPRRCRGWTKAVFWFVNFWCFVIVCFPIVRGVMVCHEFSRCLTFAHLIFDLLDVCLDQKWTKLPSTPKGTHQRGLVKLKKLSCPKCQAKKATKCEGFYW